MGDLYTIKATYSRNAILVCAIIQDKNRMIIARKILRDELVFFLKGGSLFCVSIFFV